MRKSLLLLIVLFCITCQKEAEFDLLPELNRQENIKNKKPNLDQKVKVCHKGKLITISEKALKAHLAHGDAFDRDGDGYFNKENACGEGIDCNDDDGSINPGVPELCTDKVDNNCNGLIDCADEECTEHNDCLCGYNCRVTPYVYRGLNLNLLQNGSINISADLFDAGSYDECSCSLTFSFSADPDDQDKSFDCNNLGENLLDIWVTNPAGNQDYVQTFIHIQDKMEACDGGLEDCIPLAITHSSFSIGLNDQGEVTIPATDLNLASEDICGTGQLTFSIKKQGDPGLPSESILLNCNDVGNNILELWVSDGINRTMVTTTIDLLENDVCL